MTSAAMTLAEGNPDFRTDATLIISGTAERDYILRTTLDSLSVWKTKYSDPISPFQGKIKTTTKEAAFVDGEIWVYGINATSASDIITAVQIGMQYYKVNAEDLIGNVYIKNLNAERENEMEAKALIQANKDLYQMVCEALEKAAEHLGIKQKIHLFIYSSNINHKIPQQDLHDALKKGGATQVKTDPKTYPFVSGSNCGNFKATIKSNLHLATLNDNNW
jgi:hypothetical protein